MKTWIFNDLHLSVRRTGGTTPTSADALRQYTQDEFRRVMALPGPDDNVVINGDAFDVFDADLSDVLDFYTTCCDFLQAHPGRALALCLGNHDLSKDSQKMGSAALVGALLGFAFPGRFELVGKPGWVIEGEIYAIPHLVNQSLFEVALAAVPDTKYLLLHCNFDSNFAAQTDHSLNVTRDVVRGFRDRGITTVLGHEHLGRTAFAGKLVIVGNQWSTSVADCMAHGDGQQDGTKHCMVIDTDTGGYEFVTTWKVDGSMGAGFVEQPWTDAANTPPDAKFVRITGTAEAEQAADAVRAIGRLRQTHGAYVITNAVQVAQIDSPEMFGETLEDVRTLNVIEMLLETLTADQQAVVRKIMEEENV